MHALVVHHHHLEAGEDEETAEDVEHPVEAMDEHYAGADHRPAHHHRAENAPEEHAVLVFVRDAEIGEDQRDDEHVVHRERHLDEIAGDKLEGVLAATGR